MKLTDLQDLLLEITPNVHHYFAEDQTGNYIVWAEEGESSSLYADDEKIIQVIQGTIDYFTTTEFDPVVQQIQDNLNSAEIAWRLNSAQYERDTGYTHYEWIWEIVCYG